MRLLPGDVRELPLATALVGDDGAVLAATPEWQRAGPGSTTYRIGAVRLIVAEDDVDADLAIITSRLVAELRLAAATEREPLRARRMAMLAAGIGLVAGACELRPGSTADVVTLLEAGVAAVSMTPVTVGEHHRGPVPDAAVIALALKQLVVNARRHDDAIRVDLRIAPGPRFTLEWDGAPPPQGVVTTRHQADRPRWGLGYVRLAADAVGAVALAPAPIGPRRVQAVFAVDPSPRRHLPLAAIGDDGRVERASPAWDEETHLTPGSVPPDDLARLVAAAQGRPGSVVVDGPRRARSGPRRTWVAIPPEGARDRAADAIRGLAHEQDLWVAGEPHRTRVEALVHLLAVLLGDPLPRRSPEAFHAAFPAACAALGMSPQPRLEVSGAAPDPSLTAYLLQSLDAVPVSDDVCSIAVPPHRRDDPLARRLADADGTIHLL